MRFYLKADSESSDAGRPSARQMTYVYKAHTCIFGGSPRKLTGQTDAYRDLSENSTQKLWAPGPPSARHVTYVYKIPHMYIWRNLAEAK